MRICVSGIGVVSAIGIGVKQNFSALISSAHGIAPILRLNTIHKLPVGEVKYSNTELKQLLKLSVNKTYSRTALLGMLAAFEAVKDSNINLSNLRVGIISATSVGGMDLTEEFYKYFTNNPDSGRLRDVVSHDCCHSTKKIAEYCGIKGFQTTISTACSSAANAIMLGARMIRNGYLDAVIVGGTDALCKFTLNGFNSLMILDSKECCPFDNYRNGLNLGEGAGYLVLQSEQTLERSPYCYLAGYANANDAYHQTASSAEGNGAYLAMSRALNMAHIKPNEVDYINVHGTGTINNDASEAEAIIRIWGEHVPPFSSTKQFTGHTLAAAGGIEAVYCVLAINNGVLYPNLNFSIPINGVTLTPQVNCVQGQKIKTVISNSFGFGGNNSSLIFRQTI
ncbi:MAG: beta-ketoacyl-[acyl-carrier-protein] synthase family protein [Bacteroidales bacterium]